MLRYQHPISCDTLWDLSVGYVDALINKHEMTTIWMVAMITDGEESKADSASSTNTVTYYKPYRERDPSPQSSIRKRGR